jgi:hypothetical protein
MSLGSYPVAWHDYSGLGGPKGDFRWLRRCRVANRSGHLPK